MSTLYLVMLTYVRPLEEVDAAMKAHMAWLRKGFDDGMFLVAGRRVPRTGGVILAKADDLAAVEARVHEDPFFKQKLATVEIVAFQASTMAETFKDVLRP